MAEWCRNGPQYFDMTKNTMNDKYDVELEERLKNAEDLYSYSESKK